MDWNLFLNALLLWSAVHFFGDFVFQSAWMATMKIPDDPTMPDKKQPRGGPGPNEVLLYHCLTYTATYVIADRVLGTDSNPLAFLVIFLAHMVMDWHKARKRYVMTIWLDQTLHILTLVPLIWLGWL